MFLVVVVVLTDLLPICATIMQSANIVMSGGTTTNTTTRKISILTEKGYSFTTRTRDTPPRATKRDSTVERKKSYMQGDVTWTFWPHHRQSTTASLPINMLINSTKTSLL